MKKRKMVLSAVCAMLSAVMLLSGCDGSGSYEKKLADSWYAEGDSSPILTLYSDGTCEIEGEYGTGTWAVVNDDQLKLTNYYGETSTVTIAG